MTAVPVALIQVTDVRRITPHMVRVTFAGDGLDDFPTWPDQQLKLLFPRAGRMGAPTARGSGRRRCDALVPGVSRSPRGRTAVDAQLYGARLRPRPAPDHRGLRAARHDGDSQARRPGGRPRPRWATSSPGTDRRRCTPSRCRSTGPTGCCWPVMRPPCLPSAPRRGAAARRPRTGLHRGRRRGRRAALHDPGRPHRAVGARGRTP